MMVHLKKNKKGEIFVTAVASNGRKLFPTESYTQKPSAFTNIKSILKLFNGTHVFVQDNTLLSGPVVYKVTRTSVTVANKKPSKKIPK